MQNAILAKIIPNEKTTIKIIIWQNCDAMKKVFIKLKLLMSVVFILKYDQEYIFKLENSLEIPSLSFITSPIEMN